MMKSKPTPEFEEGPQAVTRFKSALRKVLSVPHSEIQRREAEYKKRAALNPKRRGPKPKPGRAVSPGPGDV